jgi:oxygen-independent coproporphyrinogen-3 oxidase
MDDGAVGIYVHVPFCERVCPYCDFAVVRAPRLPREREDAYVGALLRELVRRAPLFAMSPEAGSRPLASLYLGGGTPSLLRPESIARLVEAVGGHFRARADLEVTLEANPGTTEAARLAFFRAAGVNRLSLGIQSFDDRVLKRLGRAHRGSEGRAMLAAARAAGYDNVSLDLIVAAPGQRIGDLARDLDELAAVAPEHVSAYLLTIEPGTPFSRAAPRGQLDLAGEEETVEMLETLAERLAAIGLERYELSSFARPGRESRHNRRYWERKPVLGIGVGAWSWEPPRRDAPFGARRGNLRGLDAWLARAGADEPTEAEPPEALDAPSARGEAAFLALRTSGGIDPESFAAEFGAPPRTFFAEAIDELLGTGLLEEGPSGRLRLSSRGILLSDSVFERFV